MGGLAACREAAPVSPMVTGALLRELATLDWQSGCADDAIARAREAITVAREGHDGRARGEAAMALGTALRTAGRAEEAVPLYEEAARRFASDGALALLGKAHNNLGVCHYLTGRVEAAADAWREALRVAEITAERDEQVILLNNLGFMYLERGAHGLAERSLDEALALATDDATAGLRLGVLGNLADVRMQQGALAAARECLDAALALAAARGARGDVVENQRRLAELLLLESAPARAAETARGALVEAEALGLQREQAHLLRVRGLAKLRLGHVAHARRALEQATKTGALAPDSLDGQQLALALAELELVAGDPARAQTLVDAAVAALSRLGAAWHADQARLLVARVEAQAESLGPPVGTAVVERAVDLVTGGTSAEEIALHTVALALEACGAEHGTLFLEPTPAHDALRVSSTAPGIDAPHDDVGDFSQTVARRVLATGTSVCLQHVEDDAIVASAESVVAMHLRSVLCVAIPLEGRFGGLLYLDSRVHVGGRFQRALPTVERLASLVGMALDRMRLTDRVASQVGLLSVVSHELRSPLTTLLGFGELAAADSAPGGGPHAATLVGVVLEEGHRMRRLVDDVHALGRAWRFTLDKAGAMPAGLLLEGAQRRARPAAAARGVHLAIDIEPGLPAVFADTERVQQVLGNLIENAMRHSPEGGQVTLRVCRERFTGQVGERRALRFTVEDEGPGIAEADADAVFERFNRGSRPKGSGSGLGLSIAQSIIHAHGGRIWVESRQPGALFHFTLPLADRSPIAE
jgi:signal transduction histidine kinase/tetratricopeptide (TPR) repeat protein